MSKMTDVGSLALYLALAVGSFAVVSSLLAYKRNDGRLLLSARKAIYAVCALVTFASLVLVYALVTHDFRVVYVAQHTSRELPLGYTLSAFWAGQEGSLLLWAWLLAVVSVVTVARHGSEDEGLLAQVMAWLMLVEVFFLVLVALVANPLRHLDYSSLDGLGLNPLLRSPGMIFHPPATYVGYVGFTVPFAFAMAALVTGRLEGSWIRASRKWVLVSWLFLSLGIGLGAQWAYTELGWGGYWAWDPVENASLMPWLTAAAFLHSLRTEEPQRRYEGWNLVLVVLTFLLSIFGAFITRSGAIASVHSFAVSALGPYFLFFLGFAGTFFAFVMCDRQRLLRSSHTMGSLFSKESAYMVSSILLFGAATVIFAGTISPLVSEIVVGREVSVSGSFFQRVIGPIFLCLLFLMGICRVIGWKGVSKQELSRGLCYPLGVGLLTAISLYFLGVHDWHALVTFTLCAFVLVALFQEAYARVMARSGSFRGYGLRALLDWIWRERRRYGGCIVHLGIVLIMIGVTASTLYQVKAEKALLPGEAMAAKDYSLSYQGLRSFPEGDHWAVVADISVTEGKELVGYLSPEIDVFCGGGERTSEVALRSTPLEDLYLVLAEFHYQVQPSKDSPCGIRVLPDGDQLVLISAVVNPLVAWIWGGGVILVVGTVIVGWPQRDRNWGDSKGTDVEGDEQPVG